MSDGRRAYRRVAAQCQPGLPPARGIFTSGAMAETPQQRAERLAAALRDNLRRRKTQAREAAPKPKPDS